MIKYGRSPAMQALPVMRLANEFTKDENVIYGFHFVVAGPLWSLILKGLGFAAIVTPWRRIYLMPRYYNNSMLRMHEAAHVMQLKRDGELKFWFLIVWYLIRYGYQASPYEVEAREIAGG